MDLSDFIERVRDANPIEDIIQEDGYPLRGGSLMTGACADCDSLNVRPAWGRAWWYSKEWSGDVFAWKQRHLGVDFMDALRILAERAGMKMPKFDKINEGEFMRKRATASAFTVAATVFHRWLMADEEALAYARERGWTDETLESSLTGFSGWGTKGELREIVEEFAKQGVDRWSPAAVAVTGYQGDVQKWAERHNLLENPDFDKSWISKERIHGIMGNPGLVYAHQHPVGKVVYLSRRNLPGHCGNDGKWKSFNPPRGLIGEKQPYYNWLYRYGKPLIMVEGQGDAITWGQWGYSSLAFCGLVGNLSTMNKERKERIRRFVAKLLEKHPVLYYAADNNEPGEKAILTVGKLFGARLQVVRYPTILHEDIADDETD